MSYTAVRGAGAAAPLEAHCPMSTYFPSNPLIAQSDKTVLLEVNNPLYEEARDALARFAELEKSPEHIHTYRITSLSLWNAAAAGLDAARIVDDLERFGKYELSGNVRADIVEAIARFGRVKLVQEGQHLLLVSDDRPLLIEIERHKQIAPCLIGRHVSGGLLVDPAQRGHIKQALLQFGYPAEDLAGYISGAPLEMTLRAATLEGQSFGLREYQQEAVDVFYDRGSSRGGSGVIVLPCGA
ncbi:MAG TPA: helicase-associated domain-containing protein, partial [Chloroflexota bacterium]